MRQNLLARFSVILLVSGVHFFLCSPAFAYPNFVGYKYPACITCHYNAFGNGPLNDYGRMIWGTEISGRLLYSKKTPDETIASHSGLLGSVEMPQWLRPSLGYRGMYYTRSLDSNPKSRYIHMQAEGSLVLKFGAKDRFYIAGTFGYVPKPNLSTANDPNAKSNYISREHYLSYGLAKGWRVFLGMMDKVYGLRIPDHVAFSRFQTLNGQNDQVHGAVLHYTGETVEWGLHGFGGNMYQTSDVRQTGGSGQIEFIFDEAIRIGTSAMYIKNDYATYTMGAVHGRWGVSRGSSIISEIGGINTQPLRTKPTTAVYGLLQNTLLLFRGFHYLTTVEYYTSDVNTIQTRQFRFGPGIQYFPMQRLELRTEIVNSRNFNPDGVQNDSWDLMSQVHLWF